MGGRADRQRRRRRDRAVDQLLQEVHDRPHRKVRAPSADLLRLGELQLLEEHGERRHLGERRRPDLEQLPHLAAVVHHLDREPRYAHVQEAGVGARRERLGHQLLAPARRPDQQQPGRREGAPLLVDVGVGERAGVAQQLLLGLGEPPDLVGVHGRHRDERRGALQRRHLAHAPVPEVLAALDLDLEVVHPRGE